jgi:Fe-S oxidoreductase
MMGRLSTIDAFLSGYLRKNDFDRSAFEPLKEEVLLHVHCHQKSLEPAGETAFVLQALLGSKVNNLRSSCCGMAGSYGMKKENQEMSKAMFNLVIGPATEAFEGQWMVATGTSCRHQIGDLAEREAVHLVDLLWDRLLPPTE